MAFCDVASGELKPIHVTEPRLPGGGDAEFTLNYDETLGTLTCKPVGELEGHDALVEVVIVILFIIVMIVRMLIILAILKIR